MSLVRQSVRPRARDVGFPVRRLLPAAGLRSVGPFVFLDHMGPARFEPQGTAGDVRPHPHIGLATVTYLFSGAMLHRDSLGVEQRIEPGDVNWMTAGRGIVHSERIPPDVRAAGVAVEGVQMWVALPRAAERIEPAFWHHPQSALPLAESDGARLRLLAGELAGLRAPTRTYAPMFYAALELAAGARYFLHAEHAERAVYVAQGAIIVRPAGVGPAADGEAADAGATDGDAAAGEVADGDATDGDATDLRAVDGSAAARGERLDAFTLASLEPGAEVVLEASEPSRVMLLGGAPLDGPRHLWWNFVASEPELIEAAKRDWAEDRFVPVPGESERIPLPQS